MSVLVLTRRPGESIRVDGDIVFTVLGIARDNIRVGVTAPRDVTVDREEVHERKLRQARAATGALRRS